MTVTYTPILHVDANLECKNLQMQLNNIPFLSWNEYVLDLRYRRLKLNSPIKLLQIIHAFPFLYERDECINTRNTSRFINENELNKFNKWQQIHHFLQVFSSYCYSRCILRFPLGWKVYNNYWTLLNIFVFLQIFCMLLFILFATSFISLKYATIISTDTAHALIDIIITLDKNLIDYIMKY